MSKNIVKAIPLTPFDTTELESGTFVAFTVTPEPLIMARFTNDSDIVIFISFDGGATTHEVCLPNDTITLNFQSNSLPPANVGCLAAGTSIFILGEPGEGFFGMSGYYQPQG